MSFKVLVTDNFHPMDDDGDWEHGTFDSLDLAIEAAKSVVDRFLVHAYQPGMGASDLYRAFRMFGETPYLVVDDSRSPLFSAEDYVKERCGAMTRSK